MHRGAQLTVTARQRADAADKRDDLTGPKTQLLAEMVLAPGKGFRDQGGFIFGEPMKIYDADAAFPCRPVQGITS